MATTDHAEGATGKRRREDDVGASEWTERRADESDARAGSRANHGDGGTVARTYEVTYAFNGYPRGDYEGIVDRALGVLSSLRADGVDIEFRGATAELNRAGQVLTVRARFAAPDEGAVGRLNCRAVLPVSGIRRIEP